MGIISHKMLVTGKVQGVWYRASTQQKARELQITGYAKNLPDGRVEIVAMGEKSKMASFIQWLWEGPPLAKIEAVDVFAVSENVPFHDFVVR